MKKTYITTMPDHIGAFLKASECFASLGVNITRVSYNKAVDSHTLFIDAEGSEAQLLKADEQLAGRLAVQHNLYFYNTLMEKIRDALDSGSFASFREKYSVRLSQKVSDT